MKPCDLISYLPIPSTVVMCHPSTENRGHRHCVCVHACVAEYQHNVLRSGYWSGRKSVRVRVKVRARAKVRVRVGPRG